VVGLETHYLRTPVLQKRKRTRTPHQKSSPLTKGTETQRHASDASIARTHCKISKFQVLEMMLLNAS